MSRISRSIRLALLVVAGPAFAQVTVVLPGPPVPTVHVVVPQPVVVVPAPVVVAPAPVVYVPVPGPVVVQAKGNRGKHKGQLK